MLIDGEKWACEACVRGHRVSSCHHSDRPLTHINKKGRPVSQCPHCRGLRKSRTTHVKCECGDKKKDHNNNNNNNNAQSHPDPNHAGRDKGDPKVENRQQCRCVHGQRCSCALKKEHHLDPVPETGLPPAQPTVAMEPKKPRLTSTKSESTLTVFRDGHHKPMHKHNDMAHKCGLPYTIPKSHTIHSTSEIAQRSADHLPLMHNKTTDLGLGVDLDVDQDPRGPQRLVKSEHGSPESAPVPALEQISTQIPPLDLSSFAPYATSATTDSPLNSMLFQDPYQESWLTSPETEISMGSAAFNAPPVDWSSFPLCSSSVPATASSQPPSYAGFDFNSNNNANNNNSNYPGLAASSSGEISEVDDFGPLPSLGASSNDLHDLHSVSDGSDVDQLRLSSASSFIGLPQTQLLSSNNLESINIDDFLKSANESTAALEQQLQASMGMEPKSIPAPQQGYAVPHTQSYPNSEPSIPHCLPMSVPQNEMNDMMWPVSLFDSAEEPFSQPPWAN
ncbi:hypothetical protein VTN77DRAFT_6375 [Rasamsonia byssochlamydoides]|uniref:uncharacterized protein n=1 Tax=Rasamsonia byssochlamydoides TaxID=89139 RepID=UPI0037443C43